MINSLGTRQTTLKHTLPFKLFSVLVAIFFVVGSATANEVSDFYKGKTINIIVPAGPASGYDIYARIMAEHFSRHMPGNPTVIVQNMPGAGGMKSARYFFSVGKTDGTELILSPQNIGTDKALGLLGDSDDVANMKWLGRFTTNVPVGIASAKSGFVSAQDLKTSEAVFAGTSARSPTIVYPTALNGFAGTKIKIVSGFDDTRQTFLAMLQGEVDGLVLGWAGLKSSNAELLENKEIVVLFQGTSSPHPDLLDVPTIVDLTEGDENKTAIRFLASSSQIGRSIATHPKTPQNRVDALRAAFAAMITDPEFVSDAKTRNMEMVSSTGHEELDKLISETLAVDPPVIAIVKETLRLK